MIPLMPLLEFKIPFLQTAWNQAIKNTVDTIKFLEVSETPGVPGVHGTVTLKPSEQLITTKDYKIVINSNMVAEEYLTNAQVNAESHIISTQYNELSIALVKQLLRGYQSLGRYQAGLDRTKFQLFLAKWFRLDFPKYIESHHDLIRVIVYALNKIQTTSRNINKNFSVVAHPRVVNMLMDSVLFESLDINERARFDRSNTYLELRGKINGLPLYSVNDLLTSMTSEIVVIQHTNPNQTGFGIFEVSKPHLYKNYLGDLTTYELIAKLAIVEVGGPVCASKNYRTELVTFNPKPLWRKLFKI